MSTKEVLITRRDEECVFPVADGLAKLSGRTTNYKNPLWDGNPPWGERISAENLMVIGKSFNLKKQKMTKESMRIFGLTQKLGKNFIHRHRIEPRSSIARAEKRIILISSGQFVRIWRMHKEAKLWLLGCRWDKKSIRFMDWISQDLIYWTKLLWKGFTNPGWDWWKFRRHHVQIIFGLTHWQEFGKANMHTGNRCFKITRAEVSEDKTHLYWYCRGKTEFCVVLQLGTRIRSNEKIWKKVFHLIFFLRWKLAQAVSSCLVSWHSVSVGQNSSSNPATREFEILSSVSLGRKKFEHRMLICSANLGCTPECGRCTHKQNMDIGKPRVTNGSDNSGDLPFRDASLGKPRSMKKRSFTPIKLIPDAKAAVDKEWKEVI